MQIQNHDELPKFDHRVLPPASRRNLGDSARPPAMPGMPGTAGSHKNWGIFKCHKWGELLRHSHNRALKTIRTYLGRVIRDIVDPDQVSTDVVALGEPMQGLAGQELLSDWAA